MLKNFLLVPTLFVSCMAFSQPCACLMDNSDPCGNNPFVFISYARQSHDTVQEIENYFSDNNIHFWSYLSASCTSSDPDYDNLENVIQRSATVLIVYSEPWKESPVCKWEDIRIRTRSRDNMQVVALADAMDMISGQFSGKMKTAPQFLIIE